MGKSSAPSSPPPTPPSAGESYGKFIQDYSQYAPERTTTTIGDVNLAMQSAEAYLPQYMEFQQKYMPEMLALEQQFAPQIQQMQGEQLARTAEQNIGLSDTYGDQMRAAMEDPQTASIRAMLGSQIEDELSRGAGLDDSLRREIEQSVRAAQSSRGIMRGSGPVAAESLIKGLQAEQLRRNRQQAASSFLQTQAQTQPNAYAAITGQNTAPMAGMYQPPTPGMPATANSNNMMSQGMNMQNESTLMDNQLQYNYQNAVSAAEQPSALGNLVSFGGLLPEKSSIGGYLGKRI